MKLGLYFSVFNHLELPLALEKAKSLGFETIEISTHTGGRFDVASLSKDRATRKTLKACGLKISAFNMSADSQLVLGPHHRDTDEIFKGPPEAKIKYATARMLMAIRLANDMEVPVISGFTGCEDYSRWVPWPDPEAWEKMEPVFVDRWSPILDVFDRSGVAFAVECHPKQMVYNTETALRSLRLFRSHRSWGFNLDPANLMLAGVDPVVFVAELGRRIVNVHAKDGEVVVHNAGRSGLLANGRWDRPDRGFRFRIAGWGDVAWRKVITELVLRGYEGPLTVEHEDPTMGPIEGVEKAVEYLRPLLIRERFGKRWW